MGQKLIQRLQQTKPLESPVDEALVSLMVASSWLSDRLESRGLVARERDADDARRSRARITPAGLDVLHRATAALGAVDAEVAKRLTTPEQRELARLCEALFGPDVD